MLPAFASIDDLALRLPGGIAESDEERAQAALDDASAKIRVEAATLWVDANGDLVEGIPDIVAVVCLAAAARALTNPEGVEQVSIGTYSESKSNASADVYLTAQERSLIRRAASGGGGLWTQPTTRGRLETDRDQYCDGDTIYVDVVGGAPIPFSDPDGY